MPADDPRFDELRTVLIGLQGRGRQSPVARMLGEYALLGYLLTTGTLVRGAATPTVTPADLDAVQAAQQHLDQALAGLDFE